MFYTVLARRLTFEPSTTDEGGLDEGAGCRLGEPPGRAHVGPGEGHHPTPATHAIWTVLKAGETVYLIYGVYKTHFDTI